MSALNASASTFSPSWMSIARLVFPSRLELKSFFGSFSEAPLAKVSFTIDLYDSPVQMIPSCDHTGVPIHFHSSTTSGSACLMSLRIRLRVSPRQSPSSAILRSISSGAEPSVEPGFFMPRSGVSGVVRGRSFAGTQRAPAVGRCRTGRQPCHDNQGNDVRDGGQRKEVVIRVGVTDMENCRHQKHSGYAGRESADREAAYPAEKNDGRQVKRPQAYLAGLCIDERDHGHRRQRERRLLRRDPYGRRGTRALLLRLHPPVQLTKERPSAVLVDEAVFPGTGFEQDREQKHYQSGEQGDFHQSIRLDRRAADDLWSVHWTLLV